VAKKKMMMMVSWKEAAVHPLWSKDIVAILLTGFEESMMIINSAE